VTTGDRLGRARHLVLATIAARALLFGGTATLVGLAIARATAAAAPDRGSTLDALTVAICAAIGVAVAGVVLARGARRATMGGVALWIEERVPSLRYALVTAAELAGEGARVPAALESRIAGTAWSTEVRRGALRSLRVPLLVALAASAALVAAPSAAAVRSSGSVRGPSDGSPPNGGEASPLARIHARVVPPSYLRARTRELDDPSTIDGIVGSALSISGSLAGSSAGVTADVGGRAVGVRTTDGRWVVSLTLGSTPGIVRLRAGSAERLVGLVPTPDSAPTVVLQAPGRDTVFREPTGTVTLRASLHDDHGLASGAVEYIVSSGEGESFEFRSGSVAPRRFDRGRDGALAGSLDLAALGLKAGDIIHLRAVARDANDVTGPGIGSSETRVLRIARLGEYDSVAVEGAPPPEADKSVLSQRMIIMLTEALEKRRPRLARPALVEEARRIARDQNRLRRAVGDIVFARLGGDVQGEHSHESDEEHAAHAAADTSLSARAEALLRAADAATEGHADEALDFAEGESPVVAINRPLLEAYNHMWEAGRHLELGETRQALPPMYRALAAIQRARQAFAARTTAGAIARSIRSRRRTSHSCAGCGTFQLWRAASTRRLRSSTTA
jgi:hypothetical protein